MNVKFKMPKFGRKLTGKAWWKELLLTFVATTISIVLTFGTAAWLDQKKKESDKREIVMMILHDMNISLAIAYNADSALQRGYNVQVAVAEHPEEFRKRVGAKIFPIADFQSTTENIVSSSIETINTIGNVLFVENVSEFYLLRKQYENEVMDGFKKENERLSIMSNYEDFMSVDYIFFVYLSENILLDMEKLFSQCKKMMKISDEELQQYQKKRMEVEREYHTDSLENRLDEEFFERTTRLSKAKERGKADK